MKSKKEIIDYCLTLLNVYEDYPFDDITATIRHNKNKKIFAIITEKNGFVNISLKGLPEENYLLRDMYESIIPGYHLNKEHWNTVVIDGNVPEEIIIDMIDKSYELTKK